MELERYPIGMSDSKKANAFLGGPKAKSNSATQKKQKLKSGGSAKPKAAAKHRVVQIKPAMKKTFKKPASAKKAKAGK